MIKFQFDSPKYIHTKKAKFNKKTCSTVSKNENPKRDLHTKVSAFEKRGKKWYMHTGTTRKKGTHKSCVKITDRHKFLWRFRRVDPDDFWDDWLLIYTWPFNYVGHQGCTRQGVPGPVNSSEGWKGWVDWIRMARWSANCRMQSRTSGFVCGYVSWSNFGNVSDFMGDNQSFGYGGFFIFFHMLGWEWNSIVIVRAL